MKRFTILPEIKDLPYNPAEGPRGFGVVAKALIREDEKGGWVHHDDAVAAIKQAAENAGGVTLRQRYKIAALSGLVREGIVHSSIVSLAKATDNDAKWRAELIAGVVKATADIADAMLAEDEEHAKK